MSQITKPIPLNAAVSPEGIFITETALWVENMTDRSTIFGTGSPEGVVEAVQSRLYMDDAGTTGSILYIKKLADIGNDATQGWILV